MEETYQKAFSKGLHPNNLLEMFECDGAVVQLQAVQYDLTSVNAKFRAFGKSFWKDVTYMMDDIKLVGPTNEDKEDK